MKNCFVLHLPDRQDRLPQIAIADLTNPGDFLPGTMTITRINVPAAHRGKGHGSALLKQITDAADAEGVILSLEINPSGPLDYNALYDWYVRHGFFEYRRIPGIYIRTPDPRGQ